MAIQPPNVNAIANPYVPDYGQIQSNAMAIKNAQQTNQLNAMKLRDYEANKDAAAKKQDFDQRLEVIKQAVSLKGDAGKKLLNKFYPNEYDDINLGEDEAGFVIRREDGTRVKIKGEPSKIKAWAEFAQKDPQGQLANNPQLAIQTAIDSGITFEEMDKKESGPYKVGQMRDFKVGDKFITKEYQADGTWKEVASADRYKTETTINNYPKAPTGFRYKDDGTLEPIPGGPAAKQTPEQAAKTQMIKSAITSSEKFKNMILDKDGNVDQVMVGLMQANVPKTEGRTAKVLLRDSIEAKLRAESGAAVPDTEVQRAAQRFSPSVLDNDTTVKLKMELLSSFLSGALDIIDPTGQYSVKDTLDVVEQELNKIEEAHLPKGVPEGSYRIGTKNGKPAFKTPDGKILVVQ